MTVRSDTVTESVVSVRGSQVRLLRAGDGEPVVYLHDSDDPGEWLPAHSALAADNAVLRPDLPGFNHSERRDDVGTVSDLAFRMWDAVDELGLASIRLIGSGLGGWLAADMATVEPARVSHLVLLGAAGLRPAGGHGVDEFVMTPAEILDHTYHSPDVRDRMARVADERAADPDSFLLALRNRAATARLAWNPYFHDVRLPDRLHRIRARTLVVWGVLDRLIPVECGHRYAELVPDARLHMIDECGHLPLIERPDDALAAIRPFLAA